MAIPTLKGQAGIDNGRANTGHHRSPLGNSQHRPGDGEDFSGEVAAKLSSEGQREEAQALWWAKRVGRRFPGKETLRAKA